MIARIFFRFSRACSEARAADLDQVGRFLRAHDRAVRRAACDRPARASAATRRAPPTARRHHRHRAVRGRPAAAVERSASASDGAIRRSPSSEMPHESRSQPRRGAQIRKRVGQIPQQREHVLDLVGVEESEALVDVGRQTVALERLLELAVALAGAEEDGDVSRTDRPTHAGRAIANERALGNQSRDLGRRRLGTRFRRVAGQNRERSGRRRPHRTSCPASAGRHHQSETDPLLRTETHPGRAGAFSMS